MKRGDVVEAGFGKIQVHGVHSCHVVGVEPLHVGNVVQWHDKLWIITELNNENISLLVFDKPSIIHTLPLGFKKELILISLNSNPQYLC